MMLTRYDGRCGACDRHTKAGTAIYDRSVMCRVCAWDFASDDPHMAAGLVRLRFARPAAPAAKVPFVVGDRAGSPSHRGGYDAIIIVASIHTDAYGTQHLSGPDTNGRHTGLQGSLCEKLKSHTGDDRFLAAWRERRETDAIQRRERAEAVCAAKFKMARDVAGGAR